MVKKTIGQKLIINASTGEEFLVDLTPEEIAEQEKREIEIAAYEAARAKQESDKVALLARLGLTEDELKTILG
jgi:hypothetical protein